MGSRATTLKLSGRTEWSSAGARWAAILALSVLGSPAQAAETYDFERAGCTVQDQKEALKVLLDASILSDKHQFEAALQRIRSADLSEDPSCNIHASALAEIALIEFKAGHTTESLSAGEAAVGLPQASKLMGLKKTAITYYLLGGAYAVVHRFENAEQAYLKSLQFMALDGQDGITRSTRVYADLSYLYMQWGKMKQAEASLQKSLEFESRSGEHNHTQEVLRRDTLCHMELEKGRLSEALRATKSLMDQYGPDKEVASEIRAHLYRDYGQLAYRFKQFEESTQSLVKCMELEAGIGASPNSGLTLATLAQVKTLQKQFEAAGLILREAEVKMLPFANDFPVNAAQVAVAAGNCWQVQGRWAEARAAFMRGVESVKLAGSPSDLLARCLQGAAIADHHLGNRDEEKSFRKQVKELASLKMPAQGNGATVDLLTLKNGGN